MSDAPDEPSTVEDALLRSSVPPTAVITPEIRDELAAMAKASRAAALPARLRRRISRGTAAGLATVVIGGFGAAAALTGSVWSEPTPDPVWYDGPHAVLEYQTPNGQVCEVSIGAFRSSNPALNAAVENFLTTDDLAELIDVEAAIEDMRNSEWIVTNERGQEVEGGYGTEHYPDPETEYRSAMSTALSNALRDELRRLGYTDDELAAVDQQSQGFNTCERRQ